MRSGTTESSKRGGGARRSGQSEEIQRIRSLDILIKRGCFSRHLFSWGAINVRHCAGSIHASLREMPQKHRPGDHSYGSSYNLVLSPPRGFGVDSAAGQCAKLGSRSIGVHQTSSVKPWRFVVRVKLGALHRRCGLCAFRQRSQRSLCAARAPRRASS